MIKFTFEELIGFLKRKKYINEDYSHVDNFDIWGFSSVFSAEPGTITWLKDSSIIDLREINADVVICGKDDNITNNDRFVVINVTNPRLVFIETVKEFGLPDQKRGIEKTAIISDNCHIGENVYIGNYVVIGDRSKIGDNTVIKSNSVIYHNTTIGSDCLIHSGAVIGADGFGFERNEDGVPVKFPHTGRVVLGDNVEIKSHTCINRGAMTNTEIHDNVKIGDLCQVSHNVIIRENTMIASGCFISGSTKVGKNCWIAPRSVIRNGVVINDGALIGLGAVVIRDVEKDDTVAGVPAKSIKKR